LRPMKSKQVQDRILLQTGVMFFKHGIRTITMDDIASNLGISKKTIYLYYRDKESLVKTFTEAELNAQEEEIYSIRNRSKDAIEEMINVMQYLGAYFSRVNPSVFYDLQKHHPNSWNAFRDFKEKTLIGFVEENLKNGISTDLYRKEIKVKVLSRLRIEEIELGFNPSVYPPDRFRLTDVQLSLIDHFIHGIVTVKGYSLIEKYKKKFIKN
jgi:TetR/AcrR family transcriptional regulator, cholesterol catabolism regulator